MKQMYVVRVAFLRRIKNGSAEFCALRFKKIWFDSGMSSFIRIFLRITHIGLPDAR
jgi:hypothetical protein